MKKIILLLVSVAFAGCTKSDVIPRDIIISIPSISFSVFNTQNEDLLIPDIPNHFSNIRLYYVSNEGEVVRQSAGLYISTYENEYRISVNLNNDKKQNKPVTYIEWGNNSRDTIEIIARYNSIMSAQDTIWLNGKVIWDLSNKNQEPYLKLIK